MFKSLGKLFTGILPFLMAAAVGLLADPGMVWAEESGTGGWRSTYDEIMLWVNFAILAFVFYKFGKDPFMDFLRLRKEDVAYEIGVLESQKGKVTARIEETREAITESDIRYADLKEKILRQGERRKQEIIDEAKEQSRIILESTKEKVGSQIQQAKRRFKEEMVDAAIDRALERLPQVITDEDNEKLLDQYMASASAK
jgi:F-type H+-transporting ATPase subunit b